MTLRNHLLAILTLVALSSMPALAQKHYSDITFPPLPDFSIPEAQRIELGNGMILFMIEDHTLPLVNIAARVGGGSVFEPADKVGLASVTGDVMRSGGTTSVPPDELNARLENIAASIETSIGETSGSAFMSTLAEYTDGVLPLFADVLMHPAFPEDKIELAKTQEKSGISRRNDDPQDIAFREFDELIYGSDSPYARTPEYYTIDAITRDDLLAFHGRFFHPNNVILGVWGDFDAPAMARKIETAFRDWPRKPDLDLPAMPEIAQGQEYGVFLVPKSDVTQSTVLMGHPGEVKRSDEDYFALTVMNQVLSGGFSSRLFQEVRDNQGLAYAVFGAYTANYDRPGQFYAGVMTKSESTVEAARAVLHEIERMQTEPPSADEMAQAKDSYLNSFVFNFDTRREIVNRMMTYEYYDYPMDYLEREKKGIEAVTADDVQRVANTYLKPGDVKILAVGDDESFGKPLSDLGAVTEIDITIPSSAEPMPEATAETLDKGRTLFMGALDALGGKAAFDAIETLRAKASSSVTTPDNQQLDIESEATFSMPDKALLVQSTPMGTFKILKNGDSMVVSSPQGEMEAPAQMKQSIESQLWHSIPYLFANAGRAEIGVQYLGTEEIDGQATEALLITPPNNLNSFTLYLHAESLVPVASEYQGMSMGGAPVQMSDRYDDFRRIGGVLLPFKTVSSSDGQGSSAADVESIEINIPIDDNFFVLAPSPSVR